MAPLRFFRRTRQLAIIHLEKLGRLGWAGASNIDKCSRGDVVCLALAHKRVVVEEVTQLRLVAIRLSLEDLLGFGTG